MTKKNKIIINSAVIALASVLFILSLVFYILSCTITDDGYGVSFDSDVDYVFLMLAAALIVGFGIISLVSFIKNRTFEKKNYDYLIMTEGAIACFYPLSVFFKALSKAISKGKTFDYVANQWYLYIGILGLALLAFGIYHYYKTNKKA